MKSSARVDYERLVSSYWENLNTVLRGFNPAEGYEFLETWVPDEDNERSLLGIVEAAKDAGLGEVLVYIGSKTLQTLDISRLEKLAADFGIVRTQASVAGVDLDISFGKRYAGLDIHPSYRNNLHDALESCTHEGVLKQTTGFELVQASHQSITLMALVDSSDRTVKEASFHGSVTDVQRGLLEVMCAIMEGKPIQECNDHAVIRLEYHLRDHSQPAPMPGIVTPQNADPAFALPLHLVRNLLGCYRKKTGYQDTENFYDQPASAGWRALSREERLARVRTAIENHPAGRGVQVLGFEVVNRVIVDFDGSIGDTKQEKLMELEFHLKQIVESTLQLYLQPEVDQNKIRRIKETPR